MTRVCGWVCGLSGALHADAFLSPILCRLLYWLAAQGPTLDIHCLVMGQDTGGAIVGAVRTDLFTG